MEYPKRSINGDAGEYLAAFTVTQMFGWPCRLYGIDLGVDAEMEILDDNGSSTGDVIKIQIKAVSSITSATDHAIYVDDRHIEYWKRFCLPVVVFCVDLSDQKIYWKQIASTEAYKTDGASKKVSFDLTNDLLSKASKSLLKELVYPPKSKNIAPLLENIKTRAREWLDPFQIHTDDEIGYGKEKLDGLIVALAEVEQLVAHYPWRFSSLDKKVLDVARGVAGNLRHEIDRAEREYNY